MLASLHVKYGPTVGTAASLEEDTKRWAGGTNEHAMERVSQMSVVETGGAVGYWYSVKYVQDDSLYMCHNTTQRQYRAQLECASLSLSLGQALKSNDERASKRASQPVPLRTQAQSANTSIMARVIGKIGTHKDNLADIRSCECHR